MAAQGTSSTRPDPRAADGTTRRAYALGGRPRRWGWLWLLLGLLLLALAALALYGLLHKDDKSDNDRRKSATPGTTGVASTSPGTGTGSSSGGSSPGGAGGGSVTSPITSGGAALLPLTPAVLSAHAGQPVTGKAAVVQAPLAPLDGILVGDSPTDSIFVDLADPLPNTPTQPLTTYQPGQKVNFTGKLVANTPEYITEARDMDQIPNVEQIIARGYHIEAVPSDVQPG